MSGATPIRLPLSARQAEALSALLAFVGAGLDLSSLSVDEKTSLREVAEKLDSLRESR